MITNRYNKNAPSIDSGTMLSVYCFSIIRGRRSNRAHYFSCYISTSTAARDHRRSEISHLSFIT
ncbi:hypothetical protein RhiirA5_357896 [Rhizophagus irregularis]|uniref:Uncharacterized protein n=1 Tax=Rhizophagus irregularis TaxID=588596 RepID=A0A2N0PNV2_9GLOM|nr:hypothetical protein RhiirA5_357896 [Rhizophagus irregularis]